MRRTLPLILAVALAGMLALPGLGGAAPTAKKIKQKRYALLAGTLFTQEGFSLPGVRITIQRKGKHKPRWRAVSDRRGEFAVRLPAGRGTYEVTTHSKDRQNQTKTVEIHGEERVDILFRLAPKKQERRKDR